MKIAVLISGAGSTLAHLIQANLEGQCSAEVIKVIADRPANGLTHALNNSIPISRLDRKSPSFAKELMEELRIAKADLILLAGWLSIIPLEVTRDWSGKMINVHPSLLPKYGGKGMYGLRVHQAVISAKEKISGATIHFVDAGIDSGQIIAQKEIAVLPNDTPESLANRIQIIEKSLLVEVLNSWII